MRNSIFVTFILLSLATVAFSQDSVESRYRRQVIKLYAQGGIHTTSVNVIDPQRNARSYFKDKGISFPSFELGALIHADQQTPRLYFGIGAGMYSFSYDGERYIRIISPSQEELEVYEGNHKMFNVHLFTGYSLWLNQVLAIKPEVGFGFTSVKSELFCNVYNYQNNQLKRSFDRDRKQPKAAAQAAAWISYKNRIDLGLHYIGMPAVAISRDYSTRSAPIGVQLRYLQPL